MSKGKKRGRGLGLAVDAHDRLATQYIGQATWAMSRARRGLEERSKCPTVWGHVKKAVDAWSFGTVHAASAEPGKTQKERERPVLEKAANDFMRDLDRVKKACVFETPFVEPAQETRVRPISINGAGTLGGSASYHKEQFDLHAKHAGEIASGPATRALDSGACRDAAQQVAYARHLWKMAEANTAKPRGVTKHKLVDLGQKVHELETRFESTCLRKGAPSLPDDESLSPGERRMRQLDLDGTRLRKRRRR